MKSVAAESNDQFSKEDHTCQCDCYNEVACYCERVRYQSKYVTPQYEHEDAEDKGEEDLSLFPCVFFHHSVRHGVGSLSKNPPTAWNDRSGSLRYLCLVEDGPERNGQQHQEG